MIASIPACVTCSSVVRRWPAAGSPEPSCGGTIARIFPDIYLSKVVAPSLRLRTVGAWLWSGRDGVIAGRAAAALQGALWVDAATPIEMIWRCGRPPNGIAVRNERIDAEDIVMIDGMPVTTPERTALDIARHLPRDLAVRHLDALARATGVKATDVQLSGRALPEGTGIATIANRSSLMDGGAESPKETWCGCFSSTTGFLCREPRFVLATASTTHSSTWAMTSRRSASTTTASSTRPTATNMCTTLAGPN